MVSFISSIWKTFFSFLEPKKPSTAREMREAVLDFIRAGDVQPGAKPGLRHALQMSYQTISRNKMFFMTESTTKSTNKEATKKSIKENQKKIKNTVIQRYPLRRVMEGKNGCNAAPSSPSSSSVVGLLSALMDEVTTSALYRTGLPSTPGVSLQMETQIYNLDGFFIEEEEDQGQEHSSIDGTTFKRRFIEEIDIVATVLKFGRTISFIETKYFRVEVNDDKADDNDPAVTIDFDKNRTLLAVSSHVKYMPTGSFITDWFYTSPIGLWIYKALFLKSKRPKQYEEIDSIHKDIVNKYVEFQPGLASGRATFTMTGDHTNCFGFLHGGCHAMIMERVGCVFAQQQHLSREREREGASTTGNDDAGVNVTLQAMHIHFLSAAKVSQVQVECDVIGEHDNYLSSSLGVSNGSSNGINGTSSSSSSSSAKSIRVQIKLPNGRICSDGKLTFVVNRSRNSVNA